MKNISIYRISSMNTISTSLGGLSLVMLCIAMSMLRVFPNGRWLLAALLLSMAVLFVPPVIKVTTDLCQEAKARHEKREHI
jgi:putative effector of murein hydrolase LrgA (UPF0299 family)